MESFNGRFKTEGESLFSEARTLAELKTIVVQRIQYYNAERRHSSLNQIPPLTFIGRAWSPAET
jgi:transposase InsO family protein